MNGSAVIPMKPEVVAPLKILSLFGIVLLVGGALAIGAYLAEVALEAERRGYKFDKSKVAVTGPCARIAVT